MSKPYNLFNKSDMRRFAKDLEKEINQVAADAINDGIEYECPNCSKTIMIKPGKNVCPHCGQIINLDDSNLQKLL